MFWDKIKIQWGFPLTIELKGFIGNPVKSN